MWREILKKGLAVLILIIFIPYIITTFVQGVGRTSVDVLREKGISLLSQEVSESYDSEMLKVQAILVRTSLYKDWEEGKSVTMGAESVQCSAEWRRRLEEAWDSTEGLILTYEDKAILAPFHRVSNGVTRDGEEALGSDEYPYLQSVDCVRDVAAQDQIGSVLLDVEAVQIVKKDKFGYVTQVKMGEETCSGEQFREAYHIASADFDVYNGGSQTRIVTHGIGHGLGLSQYTANEMAKEGKSYEEILHYFFKDVKIQKKE